MILVCVCIPDPYARGTDGWIPDNADLLRARDVPVEERTAEIVHLPAYLTSGDG